MQIHAPTNEAKEEEIDAFCNELHKLEETLDNPLNRKTSTVLEDFNAKTGVTKEDHDLREIAGFVI